MNAPDTSAATLPALFAPHAPALLALADGTMFRGRAIGAFGAAVGEVVFNTAITGYEEILTDPSYAGQIVTLTYPHIGNVGINAEDVESRRIHAAGLVVRDLPAVASSWRRTDDLATWLRTNGVVAIADIDTRRLTRLLREKGAQNGCIVAGERLGDTDAANALARARAAPSMAGLDLAKVVSCREAYEWTSSTWALGAGYRPMGEPKYRVVAYDYGAKHNILRMLAQRLARLRTGIVELAGLADDDRARADDQNRLDVGALGHRRISGARPSASRIGRTGSRCRAARDSLRDGPGS